MQIPKVLNSSPVARNLVKKLGNSNSLLPVIGLEAFVEAGRTYNAYDHGGFVEARERITEEFLGAVFWLSGIKVLNALYEKVVGGKILKLPSTTACVAEDAVRTPFKNWTKAFNKTTEMMSKFKFSKVVFSLIVGNAFIGFVLPKTNQAITRYIYKKKPNQETENNTVENKIKQGNNTNSIQNNQNSNSQVKNIAPGMATFVNGSNSNKNISFRGFNYLKWADILENNRNAQLISVDAGNVTGRSISARNWDERVEIMFRDIGSIFFYMFSMPLINKALNMIEQNHPSRLDPVAASQVTDYISANCFGENVNSIKADDFKVKMFGKEQIDTEFINNAFKDEGKDKSVIKLDKFIAELETKFKDSDELEKLKTVAKKMAKLQPPQEEAEVITKSQAIDTLKGGHINNPDFLKEFYKGIFGNSFLNKFEFVAQKDIDATKCDLEFYVKSIIEKAKSANSSEITKELLTKVSNTNLKLNALNWGTGFAVSALFLSTLIPKMQYWIRKKRTGSDEFPGTAEFRNKEQKDNKKVA